MKAKNPGPQLMDCEICGKKTVHDFSLDLDEKLNKLRTWTCHHCKNRISTPDGKFEPN
ncbi:MAG: hypothetical protein G01um101413_326 [Parcubacteria group bacterium Gr01-1014_13]|nr:MAG: hypothetical protein G01um101413_326 [Parcubacteria group bacterium Gr01-1014_13]